MRKFKRRQRHSLRFGLFLAVVGVLLLPAALAPRANAEDRIWIGTNGVFWDTVSNWNPAGQPGPNDTAVFGSPFFNQPLVDINNTQVGSLLMTTGVGQNVTISSSGIDNLIINGTGIPGTGILVDNASAFTLTIDARLALGGNQAWTNNSGNLLTVSSPLGVDLGGNALTVNGTGNTLISGAISGVGGSLIKDGSGTLTLTGTNIYTGDTAVNAGTLLVNNTSGSGTGSGAVTVNNAGSTLGGTGIISGPVIVAAGANIAPGNGGNNTAILQTGALTLSPTANFRVDINGTTAGSGYDRIQVNTGGVLILNSNLVVTVGTTVSVGQTFTILNKVAAGAIVGTFAGIPQGGTVVGSNGTVFSVSYIGGDGNDIVLTAIQAPVPEPSTWIGGALAVAGLAFTQRGRLRKLIAFSR
jgi:fibronectin-binding autotransporter adhesin